MIADDGEFRIRHPRVRIAFYAPLKPPDHPVASGDRGVARLLLQALRRAGHEAFIASRLRSFDATGDVRRQARIAALGERTSTRLIERWETQPQAAPELWFTYHLYYKAPDWLGPAVSSALGIPYIVAEGSHAAKRADGPWALGHCAVARAIHRADAVIGLNSADHDGVVPLLRSPERWVALPPFLDVRAYRAPDRAAVAAPRLIAVAMMRPGDKLASYRILGAALASLLDRQWSLEIVGDGPARAEVEHALLPLGSRITYAGALDAAGVAARLGAADLFVWPAINEAFGLALLEAQASGLPVVVGASGGVPDIVEDGMSGRLVPPGNAEALAAAVRSLLEDPALRLRMGQAARKKVLRQHDLAAAARRLDALIESLGRARAA
jgi:glycosyltransferase involved in cell wall biosynthesis